jgi:hypothetical protein
MCQTGLAQPSEGMGLGIGAYCVQLSPDDLSGKSFGYWVRGKYRFPERYLAGLSLFY